MSARSTAFGTRLLYCGAALFTLGGLVLLVAADSFTLRALGGFYVLTAMGLTAVGRLLDSQRRG